MEFWIVTDNNDDEDCTNTKILKKSLGYNDTEKRRIEQILCFSYVRFCMHTKT